MKPENLNSETQNVTEPTSQLDFFCKATPFSKYLTMTLFILMPFIGGWIGYNYAPTKEVIVEKIVYTNPSQSDFVKNSSDNGNDINKESLISVKNSNKEFASEKLGVSFTYDPIVYNDYDDPSREVYVAEEGNLISLYIPFFGTSSAKTIEVFQKDPNVEIEDALRDEFLKDYDPSDCFVVEYEKNISPSYRYFGISYPPSTTPGAPFWENSDKCPGSYSEINAVRYFVYNPTAPNKFILVNLGQDGLTTDGFSKRDWSYSIKIAE